MLGNINEDRFRLRDLNIRLIVYVILLSVIGILVVHSATANEVTNSLVSTTTKQIIGVGGGIIVMAVISVIDYRKLTKYAWVFYLLAIAGLSYVLFFTDAIYGAKRWIHIPLFGTIQPSEFSKPALLLFLSFFVHKMSAKIDKFWCILLFLLAASPILILVLEEPDLSTSIVLIMSVVFVLYLAGVSYRWVIGVLLLMVPVVVVFFIAVYQPGQAMLYSVLEEHQVQRINAYFFPELYPAKTYQQNNSIMAIGSGGFLGKGLNTSSLESVKNGQFLSEEQCDFIFAVVGEELGFLGCAVVIILIILVVVECFLTAEKCKDDVGRIIAGGVGGMIGIQSFINIGVATLLIPNTGIPLPFISAGLSSLLSTFIMIGLVLSVSIWGRQKRRVFY